ncbi:hypothetical protein OAN84_05890 [Planktomarina temperata]|nr:hypothetical protein [Planktomarina temperata]
MHQILLTCPPMIGMLPKFKSELSAHNMQVHVPKFSQQMTENDLIPIISNFDGWIIGDDPATKKVIKAGASGKLRACVRWGVGTDNLDYAAFKKLGIPVKNTPGVFGREVADIASHYVTGLARHTFAIDRQVRSGHWHKPIGTSLWANTAMIVGFGDVGRELCKRLNAHGMSIDVFDPYVKEDVKDFPVNKVSWPQGLATADFIIFTAPLTPDTFHMFNLDALRKVKKGVRIINVGRGPIIEQDALISGLKAGIISGVALDVFEEEPLNSIDKQKFEPFNNQIIFGSHNASNTTEAVAKVSLQCIKMLSDYLS